MPAGTLLSSSSITTASTGSTQRPHVFTFSDAAKIAVWSNASGTWYAVKLSGGSWGSPVSISGTNYLVGTGLASTAVQVSDTINIYALNGSAGLFQLKLPWNAATHAMGTITTSGITLTLDATGWTAALSLDSVWNSTQSYWYHALTLTGTGTGGPHVYVVAVTDGMVQTSNNFIDPTPIGFTAGMIDISATSGTANPICTFSDSNTGVLNVFPMTVSGATVTKGATEIVPSAQMKYFACAFDGSGNLDIVGGDGATTLATVKRTGTASYSAVTTLYSSSNSLTLQTLPALNFNSSTGDLWVFFTTTANQSNGEVYVAKRTSGSWTTATLAVGGDSSGYQGVTCASAWDATNGISDYLYIYATNSLYYTNGATGSPPNAPVNISPASSANTSTVPVFAWTYSNPVNSDTQLAYEILVNRVSDNAAFWDSGKVTSSASSGIAYAGTTLVNGTQYRWQVRTWDTVLNSASSYSTLTTFTPQQSPTASILSIGSGTGGTATSTLSGNTVLNAGSFGVQTGKGSSFSPNLPINVGTGTIDTVQVGGINGDTLFAGLYKDCVIRGGAAPVIYYRLNETSGTTANDSSGNGHNGTYTTNATLAVSGATNDSDKAISGAGVGKLVTYAAGTGLPTGNAARTMEIWFKGTSTGSQVFCIYGNQSTGGVGGTFGMQIFNSTTLRFLSWGSALKDFSVANVGDNAWHHFVLTYDGTTLIGYFDGSAVGSYVPGTLVTTLDANGLVLGSNTDGLYPYSGSLDEFAIYSRTLSAGEVLAHYNLGKYASGGLAHTHANGDNVSQSVPVVNNGSASSTLASSTLANATSLTVQSGKGALFTNGQMVAVGVSPNIDLVTISGIATDTLTVSAMTHAHSSTDPVIQAQNSLTIVSPQLSWVLDYQQPNGHAMSYFFVAVYDATGTTVLDLVGPVFATTNPGSSASYATFTSSHITNGGIYKLAVVVADGTTGIQYLSPFWTATASYVGAATVSSLTATPVPNSGWVALAWSNTLAVTTTIQRRVNGTSTWVTLSSGTLKTALKDFPPIGVAYDYGVTAYDAAGVPSTQVIASNVTLTGKFGGHYAYWLNDVTAPDTVNAAFGVVDDSRTGTTRLHVEDELMWVPHGLAKPKSSFGKADYWTMTQRQFYIPNTDTDGTMTTTDAQIRASVEAMNSTHNTLLYRDPWGHAFYVKLKIPSEEMADYVHTRLIFDLVETLYTGSMPVA